MERLVDGVGDRRGPDRPHAQRAGLEPVARPAAIAGGLRGAVRNHRAAPVRRGRPLRRRRQRRTAGSLAARHHSGPRTRSGADDRREPSSRRLRASRRCRSRRPPPASSASIPLYVPADDAAAAASRARGSACVFHRRTTSRSTAPAGEYLPEEVTLDPAAAAALATGRVSPEIADLVRRRVIVDLPKRYY